MGLGIRGWRSVGLEVEMCGFRDHGVEIGRFKMYVRWEELDLGSNLAPWILCSAVRTISE